MCRLLLSSLGEDGSHPLPAANSSVDVQKFSAVNELSSKAKGG